MASFLEELKKSNLQEGINKTGAGFQLPQIQPQVPQGQMLPQIQPLEDILTPEMVAQRAAARGGAGVPAVQPDPSLSRVDRFFKETIPGAVSGISELFSPLDEAASVYGERAQQKREEQAIGTAETFRKAGALKDVMLKEGSPTFSEAFEARGGTLMPQTPEAAAPAPAGTVMAPPPAAESVATGGVQPSPSTEGSPQANFEARKATGKQFTPEEIAQAEALAKSMGTTFDPETGYSRQPFLDAQAPQVQAPAGEPTTQSGIPLSQFLSGEAIPEAGLRAEAPVFSSESRGISGVAGQDIMAQASAEREARAEAQFGQVRGPDSRDRDRRMASGEGTSMADLTDMAKANARGASPRDVARGQRIADELGVDLKTGQPLEASGGLTFEQQLALSKEQRAGRQEGREQRQEQREVKEVEKKKAVEIGTAAGALKSLKADLDLIKETGEDIRTLSMKKGTEGLIGKAIAKLSPTSSAAQLERASGVLTGDAFIKGMQVIKQFGGGLGSVTEVEGLKVERAQGAIFEPGMSGEQRRTAMENYIEVRENAYNRIRKAFVSQYGEATAQEYLGDSNEMGSGTPSAGQAKTPSSRNVTITTG